MAEQLLVDTNVLLRFLTGEPPKLAQKARVLIAAADTGEVELVVLPMIVAETVYTLESFYKIDAPNRGSSIDGFFTKPGHSGRRGRAGTRGSEAP